MRLAREIADLVHPPGPPARTIVPRARAARRRLSFPPKVSAARRRLGRQHLTRRLTSDRILPIAIAALLVAASAISLAPAASPAGAAQVNPSGPSSAVRLAIGGITGPAEYDGPVLDAPMDEAAAAGYLDDATLYKPVAVDTSVQSASNMLRRYTVANGDTLTGIASRFGVSMMTVWWANKLTSKDDLKVGQTLVIPPVNGLVVTVAVGDTLDSLATEYKVESSDIVEVNQLDDPNLIVGQVLMVPGAKGEPIPTPKPTPRPTRSTSGGGSGGGGGGITYTGGAWAWPVIGGGNYISQYFHYGHYGLDIAADYGTTVVAARPGVVVFAGWKSNGGGYQVWVNHGSGIYTSYNHLSAVTVSSGQSVAKGQRVGRVGMSGWATGPHLHLEVWIGQPWGSGAYRVNPLRYY